MWFQAIQQVSILGGRARLLLILAALALLFAGLPLEAQEATPTATATSTATPTATATPTPSFTCVLYSRRDRIRPTPDPFYWPTNFRFLKFPASNFLPKQIYYYSDPDCANPVMIDRGRGPTHIGINLYGDGIVHASDRDRAWEICEANSSMKVGYIFRYTDGGLYGCVLRDEPASPHSTTERFLFLTSSYQSKKTEALADCQSQNFNVTDLIPEFKGGPSHWLCGIAWTVLGPGRAHSLSSEHLGGSLVSLNWSAPEDGATVSGYRIWRRLPDSGERDLLVLVENTGSTSTSYVDGSAQVGQKHIYRVQALSGALAGQASPRTEIVLRRTTNTPAPSASTSCENLIVGGARKFTCTFTLYNSDAAIWYIDWDESVPNLGDRLTYGTTMTADAFSMDCGQSFQGTARAYDENDEFLAEAGFSHRVDCPTLTPTATATNTPIPNDQLASERAALVAFYNATDGSNWPINWYWLNNEPVGNWYGVTTDDSGSVTHLNLQRNNLNGSLPSQLGNLKNLRQLYLPYNNLTGPIPAELGKLSKLTNLVLTGNKLSGSIPSELGQLTNLEIMELRVNSFSGSIPPELGNLSKLRQLWLGRNNLNGLIPPELGKLSEMTNLNLYSNSLSGSIPSELGKLSKLGQLWLGRNNLSGSIPTELGSLSKLTALDLGINNLSGSIPAVLGNLSKLTALDLGGNDLSGSIPTELRNLSELINLNLGGNDLSGSIPAELGNLSKLGLMNLSYNDLTGSIPAVLGNLSELYNLDLQGNNLSGSIPAALGNLSKLQHLYLSDNSLSGPIPSELGNLSKLEYLNLSGNNFCGTVPARLYWVLNRDLPSRPLPACAAATPTATPTFTPTASATATPSATPTSTATAIETDTPTATATASHTPTASTTPAARIGCIQVGPGTYWLFPASNFLSGDIVVHSSNQCVSTGTTQQIGAGGYVYTADGESAAAALCDAGHGGGAYQAQQQALNTSLYACQLAPPTATPVPPTDTPAPQQQRQSNAPDGAKPGRAHSLAAAQSGGSVALSWSVPEDGGAVSGYRIWRRLPDRGETELRVLVENTGSAATSYVDSGAVAGQKHIYRVQALSGGLAGQESLPAQIVVRAAANDIPTPTPAQPTNTPIPQRSDEQQVPANLEKPGRAHALSVAQSGNSVALNWSAPGDGGAVSGYRIWRRLPDMGEGGVRVIVNNTGSAATSYVDSGAVAGQKHIYRVQALNSSGEGQISKPSQIVVKAAPTNTPIPPTNTPVPPPPTNTPIPPPPTNTPLPPPPPPPTNTPIPPPPPTNTPIPPPPPTNTPIPQKPGRAHSLTLTQSDGAVSLSWSAPDDGGAVSGYRIWRRLPDKGEQKLIALVDNTGSATTSFVDSSAEDRQKHIYRVQALNEVGEGQWSKPAQIIVRP